MEKTKNKQKPLFNYNTPLGKIIDYCKAHNKIFEVNEKGYMLYDLIPNPEKELDKIALGKIYQVHIKNGGKKKFSDFGNPPKRITKSQARINNLINTAVEINKIVESGYYSNCWGEKFPYVKLQSGMLVVYKADKKTVKMTIDNFNKKRRFMQ